MKLIPIALAAIFLFTGCNSNTEPKEDKPSSSSSSSSKKSVEDAVFGNLKTDRLK